ncbi:sirohydrochlorin chelatase [Streptomyces lasiicapitis]|uniref:sirohydrochlorin chelatase n=1 Tax=Streptomyces lasiicapitis TaxID=1923961 RepID=UPI003D9F08D1
MKPPNPDTATAPDTATGLDAGATPGPVTEPSTATTPGVAAVPRPATGLGTVGRPGTPTEPATTAGPGTTPAPATTPAPDTPTAPDTTAGLGTAAQLMTRITGELGARLGLVTLSGSRRPCPGDRAPGRESVPALVVVAHGSRDPRALATVTALLDVVRALRPGLDVRLGHIELNEPALDDTLRGLPAEGPHADGGPGAVLVPLLLSRGYHVKHDIPAEAAAASLPGRPLRVAAPLGPHRLLDEALHARLVEAGWPAGTPAPGHGVVLAAAGSRDPDSAADTRRAAHRLARRLGVPVVPAYAAPTEQTPTTVPAALRALAAAGVRHAAVASYFTAPGRFATQAADAAPWLAAAPLGAHPALAALLLHRYDQACSAVPQRQLTSA